VSEALFQTLLLFGTVDYPRETRAIVEIQIVIDFLLFAVFLAFFVGNLGSGRSDKDQAS
jgi:hypothetical protein